MNGRSLILLLDQLRFETALGKWPTRAPRKPATTQTKTVIAAYEMRCIFGARVQSVSLTTSEGLWRAQITQS
jgi:hypothetical protein